MIKSIKLTLKIGKGVLEVWLNDQKHKTYTEDR